jgi:ribonuclease HI
LVNRVLQTPVSNIIATRNGTAALTAMLSAFEAPSELRSDGREVQIDSQMRDRQRKKLSEWKRRDGERAVESVTARKGARQLQAELRPVMVTRVRRVRLGDAHAAIRLGSPILASRMFAVVPASTMDMHSTDVQAL